MSETTADSPAIAGNESFLPQGARLTAEAGETAGNIVLMQIHAMIVCQQPDMNPDFFREEDRDDIRELQRHQNVAKTNAAVVLQTLTPLLINRLNDLRGYFRMFEIFSTAILKCIDDSTGDLESRKLKINGLLESLRVEAARHEARGVELGGEISRAQERIRADATLFQEHAKKLETALGDHQGRLAEITKDIESTKRTIDNDIAGITVAALGAVAGGVIIAVGALATLPAGVTGVGVILTGVGIAVTGTGGLIASSVLLTNNSKKLADLYASLASLHVVLAAAKALSEQVGSLSETMVQMNATCQAMNNEWALVCAGVKLLRDEVEKAAEMSDLARLRSTLQIALNDWDAISRQIDRMEEKLISLSPTLVDTLPDMKTEAED